MDRAYQVDTSRRIVILGAGGAGKSTLARQLGALLNVPVTHLDPLYWQPGFVELPWSDIVSLAAQLAAREDAWVIEGSGVEGALPEADLVIFLDLPRWRYLARFAKRWLVWRLSRTPQPSSDRPPYGESLRPAIWSWLWTWHRHERPKVLTLLASAQQSGKRIIWLRTPGDVHRFISTVS
jgi:hypothetical protein